MSACPCCDIETIDGSLSSNKREVMALAIGVMLGGAFADIHRVTELMCTTHRPKFVIAMARASAHVNRCSEDRVEAEGDSDG